MRRECSILFLLCLSLTHSLSLSLSPLLTILTYPSVNIPAYVQGVKINSPHYLAKLPVRKPGKHTYVIVLSQHEKTTNIDYTLRVYRQVFVFRLVVIVTSSI